MNDYRQTVGKNGELVAQDYLKEQGYKILETNYRFSRLGEIDIIARKDDDLIFVEVKTRTNYKFGNPQTSVNRPKIQKITKTARHYLKQNFEWEEVCWRIDIIEVFWTSFGPQINHIPHIT